MPPRVRNKHGVLGTSTAPIPNFHVDALQMNQSDGTSKPPVCGRCTYPVYAQGLMCCYNPLYMVGVYTLYTRQGGCLDCQTSNDQVALRCCAERVLDSVPDDVHCFRLLMFIHEIESMPVPLLLGAKGLNLRVNVRAPVYKCRYTPCHMNTTHTKNTIAGRMIQSAVLALWGTPVCHFTGIFQRLPGSDLAVKTVTCDSGCNFNLSVVSSSGWGAPRAYPWLYRARGCGSSSSTPRPPLGHCATCLPVIRDFIAGCISTLSM